ncbi:hypothetical protein HMPREF1549_00312 [Actinomyces johnsonii F0510]|uniref:Uncharacterized protein n=1 Tax=Actinomyces johnsonii F0510 TaxID=1227262 RepID=U1RU80_9ACTO|nr:hypothetical protein HMPREF1549_00312 [Actinomyces johnsonii F0510]
MEHPPTAARRTVPAAPGRHTPPRRYIGNCDISRGLRFPADDWRPTSSSAGKRSPRGESTFSCTRSTLTPAQ